ncbi:caffeic acid 3-O-methyltransferase-like [Salvia splendens]|uniref:caffeic acid 3-O-methyltransferase-like n=1 Tax=Salvia splendens TaxID=180675 RepID=UPI001C27969C|nr:caffeic acid 3-O-methyltransferase-like [Salvia splendens]
MSTEEEASTLAIKCASGAVLPLMVKTSIELDLFQLIKNAGSISAAELAAQLPTSNPGARALLKRILRLLAAHSILSCEGGDERRYALSAVGSCSPRMKKGFVRRCCYQSETAKILDIKRPRSRPPPSTCANVEAKPPRTVILYPSNRPDLKCLNEVVRAHNLHKLQRSNLD